MAVKMKIEYPFPGNAEYIEFYSSDLNNLKQLPPGAYHAITDDGVLHEDEGEIVEGKWKQKLVPSNRQGKLEIFAYDQDGNCSRHIFTLIDGRVIAIVKVKN